MVHVAVIDRDTLPMTADASGYYRSTIVMHRHLAAGELSQLWRYLIRSGIRPPLPQLTTVVFYGLFGECSQRAARLSNLLFAALLLVGVFGLGTRLKDRETGLAAAVLVTCFPQVVGYSRCYWMDVPLAAMVTLGLWALVASNGLRRRGVSLVLGLTLGLGLLTKYAFAVFLAGPLLHVLVVELRGPGSRRQRRLQLENLCLAVLSATALTAFWYVPSIETAWNNFAFNQGTAGVLLPRPMGSLSNLMFYPRQLVTTQLGVPLGLTLALLLPLFLRHARGSRGLLLTWFAVPYLFFTYLVLGIAWSRLTLAYLPAMALIMALAVMQFRLHRAWRALGWVLCIAALAGQFLLSFRSPAVGPVPWERMGDRGLVAARSWNQRVTMATAFPSAGPIHWTQVALAPDVASLGSMLTTWAMEQQLRINVSNPYELEAHDFGGRFRFPRRVGDPRYLREFDYVVITEVPPGTGPIAMRRPRDYQRFVQSWRDVRSMFGLTRRLQMPGGMWLAIYRNRRLTPAHLFR